MLVYIWQKKPTILKNLISIFSFLILSLGTWAQQATSSAAHITKNINKLRVTTRVLYLAAHPDDENTRLISYLSKGKNIQTAYLSLTRGDGGQNLIGDEKGAYLGIIRTQELLEARKLDGGQQFFTRAVDFGYSKNPTETFQHWNKDSVLADVVRVIRMYQPHIIITRFPPDERAGHGHHTASAILAELAFDAASDSNQFAASANQFGTWSVDQLYWNESSWWNKNIAQKAHQYATVDVGEFDPVLGESYTEIASYARSQHKSQGFGTATKRGATIEYLKLIKGDSTATNPLSGEVSTWAHHTNGKKITKAISKVQKAYTPAQPTKALEPLFALKTLLSEQPKSALVNQKIKDVDQLIIDCSGLWLDFQSNQALLPTSSIQEVTAQAISQHNYPFTLQKVLINNVAVLDSSIQLTNQYTAISQNIHIQKTYTTPYWLENKLYSDWFLINNRNLIGQPSTPSFCMATFELSCPSGDITVTRPLKHKWTDRAVGELYRSTHVVNPISVYMEKKVVFSTDSVIQVRVKAHQEMKNITVSISPDNGVTFLAHQKVPHLVNKQEVIISFKLDSVPDYTQKLTAFAGINAFENYRTGATEIAYPHIQTQVVNTQAEAKFINQKIRVKRTKIGYIVGSGDEIPNALKNIGCEVTILNPQDITLSTLQQFEGIVVGIRAYNKIPAMTSVAPILNNYVEQGGFVMVQYNTNRGMVTKNIGPYPITLSRTRVTEEHAQTTLLMPDHEIFSAPNVITQKDFDHWVQERGLYFAGEWDNKYTPLIAWNDTNEPSAEGALLITQHGKGHYVFTGISFFRQLPAGVEGAYKLFANLISYGAKK